MWIVKRLPLTSDPFIKKKRSQSENRKYLREGDKVLGEVQGIELTIM